MSSWAEVFFNYANPNTVVLEGFIPPMTQARFNALDRGSRDVLTQGLRHYQTLPHPHLVLQAPAVWQTAQAPLPLARSQEAYPTNALATGMGQLALNQTQRPGQSNLLAPGPPQALEYIQQYWNKRRAQKIDMCQDCGNRGPKAGFFHRLCPLCWRPLQISAPTPDRPDLSQYRPLKYVTPREALQHAQEVHRKRLEMILMLITVLIVTAVWNSLMTIIMIPFALDVGGHESR